ncbi:MAG: citrate synthase [Sedimentisphaerales bacterium]|nr:citrate synthase [Sedimentisphaerales bacterium]
MTKEARLIIDGKEYTFPVITGSENEDGIDITQLRNQSGCITLDPGFANTGSCISSIAFIDGEKGVLRYRGIPIEDLAQNSTFIEVAYLLIWGELPSSKQLARFSELLTDNAMLHENLKNHFEGFPWNAHPMAMLSAMINALGCYHKELSDLDAHEAMEAAAARIISKVRTIAAFSYKMTLGEPFIYPAPELRYVSNFLHMMFSVPHKKYEAMPEVVRAIDLMLMLHADHEQNCSTSTVRIVASAGANLFSSISAGVCALWGRQHGGANMAVIKMLEDIYDGGMDAKQCVEMAKDKNNPFRLMGFGHRVYKNYDPRARILKMACDKLFTKLKHSDPLLDIALELEEMALQDDYFQERNLYPNVDFYSGLIMRAIGIPTNMFTVIFAIGRLPGWIAHWREVVEDKKGRIARPRQIYTGYNERHYIPIDKREDK